MKEITINLTAQNINKIILFVILIKIVTNNKNERA
jgi:hypothetical protein